MRRRDRGRKEEAAPCTAASRAQAPEELDAWLQPVAEDSPAGPNLEYDTDYATLQARMAPAVEVQYGTFTQRREGAPWPELERACRDLLLRSRDITLLVWWLRCRVRNGGAVGFAQGLRGFVRVLRRFGPQLHPQMEVDGVRDPVLRANALALLGDADALLADVRDLVALRSAGEQRRVRDIERELGGEIDAREALREWLARSWHEGDPTRRSLQEARQEFLEVLAWAREDLGEAIPDLSAMQGLLEPFAEPPAVSNADFSAADASDRAVSEDPLLGAPGAAVTEGTGAEGATATTAPTPDAEICGSLDRRGAQACIARARAWFDAHEPSSPVGVLLRQAERLVGKRYAEVAQAIPADLLARWESS